MESKKKCAVCGMEFTPYHKRHKYCCKECQNASVETHRKTDEFKKYMREHQAERRKALRALHRCVTCGKQDTKTLAGKVRCAECAVKASYATTKYKERKSRKEVS